MHDLSSRQAPLHRVSCAAEARIRGNRCRGDVQVRATVRDASNTTKHAHLKALADALPGTLELFSADLQTDGAFDEVVR